LMTIASRSNFFLISSISQRNFLGRGQTIELKAEVGSKSSRFTFSFTEPWLFDIPLSAGFDLYNWITEYDYYDKDSKGGSLRAGYTIFDYTRVYLSYSYEQAKIYNVIETETIESEGTNITSSVSNTLSYDSRDKIFNTTEGSEHSFTIEYAGNFLGGNIAYTKYIAETGWYFPLFWSTLTFLHGKSGYVEKNPGGRLPDYERFYLGGMNSIRGFDFHDISGTTFYTDALGNLYEIQIGGNKFVQFNAEYQFPLIKKAGIMGLLFYDTGNVFMEGENIALDSLRESAGCGVRWYSPIGPIRLEYGYILDRKTYMRNGKKEREGNGGWEFTMGGAF
ncbi:MAG: BamA/TamA family outer membrane protein, partial [Desulfobacterales bacterium]|nr:BamA/TamA family outer membrane protein [Desulfobacterales bacterium]